MRVSRAATSGTDAGAHADTNTADTGTDTITGITIAVAIDAVTWRARSARARVMFTAGVMDSSRD